MPPFGDFKDQVWKLSGEDDDGLEHDKPRHPCDLGPSCIYAGASVPLRFTPSLGRPCLASDRLYASPAGVPAVSDPKRARRCGR
jgi:hypothetical protein